MNALNSPQINITKILGTESIFDPPLKKNQKSCCEEYEWVGFLLK